MTAAEFDEADPRYFRLKVEGYRKAQADKDRADWVRIRWLAAAVITPHYRKAVAPTDLFEFAEETAQRIEEMKQLAERLNNDKRFPKEFKKTTHEQSN